MNKNGYVILHPTDHAVLGESEFGMPGLRAIESIGPFTQIQAVGPLITVHDAIVEPHLGIGHHRHRLNERLFYIEQGELDHDDSLNNIRGHIGEGDVGQFTEGQRGMMHSEWNNSDIPTRAYILVYTTDPIPQETDFTVLKAGDAPRYQEDDGVQTIELVGRKSPLQVNGDIRLFTDSRLENGAVLSLPLSTGEGALVSVRQGRICLNAGGEELPEGSTLIIPPSETPVPLSLQAQEPSRVIRVVFGQGHGFVHGVPRYQTKTQV